MSFEKVLKVGSIVVGVSGLFYGFSLLQALGSRQMVNLDILAIIQVLLGAGICLGVMLNNKIMLYSAPLLTFIMWAFHLCLWGEGAWKSPTYAIWTYVYIVFFVLSIINIVRLKTISR